MSREQILERERRWAVPVGITIAVVICVQVAGAVLLQTAGLPGGSRLASFLRAVDPDSSTLLLASVLRGLGFALLAIPLAYLFRAASIRDATIRSGLIGVVVAGPLFLGAAAILQQIAINDIASQFVGRLPVDHPEALAKDLQGGSTLIQFSLGLTLAGTIGFLVGVVYTSRRAMRVGLLTRFWGTLGMAAGMILGLATLIPSFAPAGVLVLTAWLVYLLLVVLDWVPRSPRPPAWEAGEAVPWPEQAPGAGRGGGLFGGPRQAPDEGPDAVETTGSEASEAAAASPARERGERRKRKRRR